MQTPLITNFARGVLSPKFWGRVDTEVYHQGAALLEDFIVNNQGSIQRRPGTYRLWNTGFTHPSPENTDVGRFAVEVVAGQRYSLVLLNDHEVQAQFILSKGGSDPQHRFFEIQRDPTDTPYTPGLFALTQFTEDDSEFFPEAHAFSTGNEQVVDDSFSSGVADITFLRLRDATGYTNLSTRAWHSTVSRDIARGEGEDIPFVGVGPLDPPEYKRRDSTLQHSVGFRVYKNGTKASKDVTNTFTVPQFVGQMLSGGYESGRERSRLLMNGSIRNVTHEPFIDDMGYVVFNVPDAHVRSTQFNFMGVPFSFDTSYQFYRHYPGRSKVYVAGKSVEVDTNETEETIRIRFSTLHEATEDWLDLERITVRRTRRRRNVCTRRFAGFCTRRETKWYNLDQTVDMPEGWLDDYKNRVYDVTGQVQYVPGTRYNLYYRFGPREQLIDSLILGDTTSDLWEIDDDDGSFVTKIKIFNEANINPIRGKQLPDSGAEYVLERVIGEEEPEMIYRRALAWDRDEQETDFSLEFASTQPEWLQASMETIQSGKTAIVHNGRLMLLEDESDLRFIVSTLRDYANFYEGESEVDAYKFNIETDRAERIQWAISVRDGIIVGTDHNEYVVLGVESPSSVQARRYTGIGSSRPHAIRFGDKILFVSRDARRIMAYSYSDELAAWHSSDLSSIADHLFTVGIQSMHYMQDPISVIWVVPEGNKGIYSLTWEPTSGVMAWSHHMKEQNILAANVATIEGTTALFLAVERQGLVSIEVMDFRDEGVFGNNYYLDSTEYLFWEYEAQEVDENEPDPIPIPTGPDGEFLDGETNYTIDFGTGRWARFQGQDVVIMVNGETEMVRIGDERPHSTTQITVGPYDGADIQFDLEPETTVTVAVGIPYTSRMKTLPIMTESRSGPGVFKNTQTQKMRVRIENSGSFQVSNAKDDLIRVELAESDELEQPEEGRNLYTGDVQIPMTSSWSSRPQVYIESYYASPLNILALMVDSQVFE